MSNMPWTFAEPELTQLSVAPKLPAADEIPLNAAPLQFP
jgi:hypothetical protein